MRSGNKIVPIIFWVGFLALGFVTSLGGSGKNQLVNEALVTETEDRNGGAAKSAQD